MIQIKPYDPYSRLCTSINCPSRFCNHSPHFHSKGSNRISYPLSLCPFLSGSRYTIHAPCFCLLTLAPSNEIEESNQFSLGLCEKVTKSYFNRLLGLRLLGLYVLLIIFASKKEVNPCARVFEILCVHRQSHYSIYLFSANIHLSRLKFCWEVR